MNGESEREAQAAYEAFNAAHALNTNTYSPKWEYLHEELQTIWTDAVERHKNWGTFEDADLVTDDDLDWHGGIKDAAQRVEP